MESDMNTRAAQLQQRNQEIGVMLQRARVQQHRSVSECAMLLGTSRRRYSAIERGEVGISAAELEILLSFLDLPLQTMWNNPEQALMARQVVIKAQPGETVQFVVEMQI
jgi:transcriptional regulator with XRE-family HTH domain